MALGATGPHDGRATSSAGAWCRPGAGLLVGIPAALALARFMDSVVFGVTAARSADLRLLLPLLLTAVAGRPATCRRAAPRGSIR